MAPGRTIRTARTGAGRFVVTAVDKNGARVRKAVRYFVFEYVNPVREVSGLTPRRIDLGVDYAGWGPLLLFFWIPKANGLNGYSLNIFCVAV